MRKRVCLIGNPNVGKSTVFNALTGMRVHTGNWSGKTVGSTTGSFIFNGTEFEITDLPGIYSLSPVSEDERRSVEYIKSGSYDICAVVIDATCPLRGTELILELMDKVKNMAVCVNLIDEAERKNIVIDLVLLEKLLGVSVTGTSAASKKGIDEFKAALCGDCRKHGVTGTAEEIYGRCVSYGFDIYNGIDRKIDRTVLSGIWGIPLMLCLLGIIFYLTVLGANVPSSLLGKMFAWLCVWLSSLCDRFNVAPFFKGILVDGIFRTLGWVVSVMLPPMAVFFPLFSLLEDVGYLPRLAFMLDKAFKRAGAHGKNALTVCMGFGCNAVGVTAARIIDSPRERLIAILTNSFIPCNGRFPTIIMLAAILTGSMGATTAAVFACIAASVFISLVISFLLSKTVLKGVPSVFALELPPYRRPNLKNIIIRSITDKILVVLARAIAVSVPAGALIWLMQNTFINGASTVSYMTSALDGFGHFMGLDGSILTAFILGMPANEIVMPLTLMCYGNGFEAVNGSTELSHTLLANGWSAKTAVCMLIFTICHFPCATTLLTIKKETGSLKQTAAAFVIPLAAGILLCAAVNFIL